MLILQLKIQGVFFYYSRGCDTLPQRGPEWLLSESTRVCHDFCQARAFDSCSKCMTYDFIGLFHYSSYPEHPHFRGSLMQNKGKNLAFTCAIIDVRGYNHA